MNKIKKIFGKINITWSKLIIMALVIGIYTAASILIPITRHTSFSDLGATFEVWIFFGIFIIMNSKSAKESALKCFVFFLISQPLIYIIQDLVEKTALLKTYYGTWFIWTVFCIPMGFIGYYMKKDKWWGLVILFPILVLLGFQFEYYVSNVMFSFPRHILTVVFCVLSFIIYPLCIFNNKKIKIIGLIISILIMIVFLIKCFGNKPVYNTEVLLSGNTYQFDNNCSVIINDDSIGKLSIKYIDSIEDYSVHGEFIKEGKTSFILECSEYKKEFDLTVKSNTYDVKERIE
jgi:hypothetical protein